MSGAVAGLLAFGATGSGRMLMGVSRYAASEFSFLLAVPMMGATVLDLSTKLVIPDRSGYSMFAVGF